MGPLRKERMNVINIDGVDYAPVQETPEKEGMPYVITRGDRSSAFAGWLESQDGQEVVLREARRLWYWDGAASLSQLAVDGTSEPQNCKFPAPVGRIRQLDAIEIIDCTEKARASIEGVEAWQA